MLRWWLRSRLVWGKEVFEFGEMNDELHPINTFTKDLGKQWSRIGGGICGRYNRPMTVAKTTTH